MSLCVFVHFLIPDRNRFNETWGRGNKEGDFATQGGKTAFRASFSFLVVHFKCIYITDILLERKIYFEFCAFSLNIEFLLLCIHMRVSRTKTNISLKTHPSATSQKRNKRKVVRRLLVSGRGAALPDMSARK